MAAALSLHAGPNYSSEIRVSGYTGTETLENFPVLVKLSESRIEGFRYADLRQPENGGDIWFSEDAAGLKPVAHEIDEWNVNGNSLIWVSLPKLNGSTKFFMHYGDDAPPVNTPSKVWADAGYVAVWHMNEASGDCADSSGNGLTAVPTGAKKDEYSVRAEDGAVGGCRQNSASDARATGNNTVWMKVSNSNTLISNGKMTISCWFKFRTNSLNNYTRVFSSKVGYSDASGFCGETSQAGNSITLRAGGSGGCTLTLSPYGSWNHMVVSYDGGVMNAWHNGGEHSVGSIISSIGDIKTDIGLGSNRNGNEIALNGWMDEYRIRSKPATAIWAKAEYDAASNDSFLAYGAVADNGSSVTIAGMPGDYGGTAPAYGIHRGMTPGTEYTFTAAASVYEDAEETVRWDCTGWELFDRFTGELISSGATTKSVFAFSKPVTLVWNWTKNLRVNVGEEVRWAASGESVSIPAPVVEGREFYCWNDVDGVLADASQSTATFVVDKPVTLIPQYTGGETTQKIYIGPNNGSWSTAANWDPAGVPTLLDDVVIPNGRRVDAPAEIFANSITLNGSGAISQGGATTAENEWVLFTSHSTYGNLNTYGRTSLWPDSTRELKTVVMGNVNMNGSSQWLIGGHASRSYKRVLIGGDFTMSDTSLFAVYAGPGDMQNEPGKGGALVKVSGFTSIGSGAVVDAFCHTSTHLEFSSSRLRGTGAYVFFELGDGRIEGKVRSRVGVTEYSELDLLSLGVYGDGSTSQLYGGGHGGTGGGISDAKPVGGPAYDYLLAPILPGAPGTFARTWGGGVIRIDAGTLAIDGTINADVGFTGNNHERAQGAGGSIWISCSAYTLGANAMLTARGGDAMIFNAYTPGGGGGGRIAIAAGLTSEQKNELVRSGVTTALSAETSLLVMHPGNVSVAGGMGKNGGKDGQDGTAVYYRWVDPKQILVSVKTNPEGMTGEFTPANGEEYECVRGETFTARAPEYAMISERTRRAFAGWTFTVDGEIVASGSGREAVIENMQSSAILTWNYAGVQHFVDIETAGLGTVDKESGWYAEGEELTIAASGTVQSWVTGEYLAGDLPKASSYSFVPMGPCRKGVVFAGALAPLAQKEYTGPSQGDWDDPANWTPAGVPRLGDAVVIPPATVVCVKETAVAGSLTIGAGASLSVYGKTPGWTGLDSSPAYNGYGIRRNAIGREALDYLSEDRYPSVEVAQDIILGEGAELIVGGYWQRAQSLVRAGRNIEAGENSRIAVYAGELVPEKGITLATGSGEIVAGGAFTLESGAWLSLIAELPHNELSAKGTLSSVAIKAGEFIEKAGSKVTSYFGSHPYVNNSIGVGGEAGNLGCHGGSGHGGAGGAGSAYGGAAFDLAEYPLYPGPCGRYHQMGAAGGGVIRVVADKVVLGGTNDVSAEFDNSYEGGGAAGGSINIRSRGSLTILPTALFKADGRKASKYGSHVCGGGAGGRIALLRGVSDEIADMLATHDDTLVAKALRRCSVSDQRADGAQFAAQVSVNPGEGVNGGEPGEPGTAVLVRTAGFIMMLK